MAFDRTLADIVSDCASGEVTDQELLEKYRAQAAGSGGPVPDHAIKHNLPQALRDLAAAGWLRERFDKGTGKWFYVTPDGLAEAAKKADALNASLHAHRQPTSIATPP